MRTSVQIDILHYFQELAPRPVTRKAIGEALSANRGHWKAPKSLDVDGLISLLLENDVLKTVELISQEYGIKQRYTLGTPSVLQVATSFYKDSFLSHATALYIHKLSDSLQTIYVNHEQSKKNTTSRLNQVAIDRAFSNQQRQSAYLFHQGNQRIVFLNGKNTGQAGVIEAQTNEGASVRVTDLERTLLDAVVRPRYVGTIREVADAFQRAASRVSAEHLADIVISAQYVYPYQQSLGFLLERAGVPSAELEPLRRLRSTFDFYLDYKIEDSAYDPSWKIHFPKDL
jgi:hypothetical protein